MVSKEEAAISQLNAKITGLSQTIDQKDKEVNDLNTKLKEKDNDKPKIDEDTIKEKLKRTLDLINDRLENLQSLDLETGSKRTGKSIAEDLHALEHVSKPNLEKYRKEYQELIRLEREAADLMLTLQFHYPKGLNDLSAQEVSKTWNMDMNSFLAILFELTRRH